MIETKVIDYLKKELEIEVFGEIPEKPPKRFLVVEKTGGGEEEMLEHAMIAVQSYEESLYLACVLNRRVKIAMKHMNELPDINSIKLNGDTNFTDLSMKRYRYQAVFEIVYY